jgi:DNA-binding LacI/PurR family transcriptional regulator
MAKPARLKDVAGVATTTAARVLENSGSAARDIRERVLRAVKVTDHRVSSLARLLRRSGNRVSS